jgi:hypothetical protein
MIIRTRVVNIKNFQKILFLAATSLAVSCTLPDSRVTPSSSSPTPAAKNKQGHTKTRTPSSSSPPVVIIKPRYRVLENYGNKAFEDTATGNIWTMLPVAYHTSQSLAVAACKNSKLGAHHWALPSATDFTKLIDPKDDFRLPADAPFRHNYDKYGPFWTNTKAANISEYYVVVGFDKKRKYGNVDAYIGRYTAVCIQN